MFVFTTKGNSHTTATCAEIYNFAILLIANKLFTSIYKKFRIGAWHQYTRPDHRRTGVATGMLERLVADARARGVTAIGLEATRMGRPLYLKYGFVQAGSEMELPEAPDPKAAPGDSGEE